MLGTELNAPELQDTMASEPGNGFAKFEQLIHRSLRCLLGGQNEIKRSMKFGVASWVFFER